MTEILTGEIKEDIVSVWYSQNEHVPAEKVIATFKGGEIDFRPYDLEIKDLGILNGRRQIFVGGIHIGALSFMLGLRKSVDFADDKGIGKKVPYPKLNSKNWQPGEGVDLEISPVLLFYPSQIEKIKAVIQQPTVQ